MNTVTYAEMSHGPAPIFMIIMFMVIGLFALLANIIYVIAFCKIFSKAGYSWALGLLMLVPIANFIMPLILGFGQWPILTQRQSK